MLAIRNRLFVLTLVSLLVACGQSREDSELEPSPTELDSEARIDVAEAALHLWQTLTQESAGFTQSARLLAEAVNRFLAEPNNETLLEAQAQWQQSAVDGKSLALLITLLQQQPALLPVEFDPAFRLLASPIQPGFLDRFGPYPYSGLVFDIGIALSQQQLVEQHGLTDREEVVLGIYAIEFMLFGEQASRSAQDYVPVSELSAAHRERGLESVEEVSQNRRRHLLQLQLAQLVADASQLEQALQSTPIPSAWQALPPARQIAEIRSANSAVVTELMIAVGELQNAIAQLSTSELPSEQNPLTPEVERAVATLQRTLATLDAGSAYYSEVEQEAIRSTVEDGERILKELPLDQPDAEQSRVALQSLYEKLKNLL